MTSEVTCVTLFTNEFPPGPGGIGNQAYHLAGFLAETRRVDVFSGSRSEYQESVFDRMQKFSIHRYPVNHWISVAMLQTLWSLWLCVRKSNVVILSGSTQLLFILPILWLTGKKTLAIVHGHELHMAGRFRRQVLRLSISRATEVVAVSAYSRDRVATFVSREIRVIPNGVHVPQIKPMIRRGLADGTLRLITVGTVSRRKGQHNVISVLPVLLKKFSRVEYHMVGLPQEQDRVMNEAEKLGVKPFVFTHGALDDSERDALLTKMDLFMMLSEALPNGDTEGFGIALLEANSMGIPGIGSKGTGIEQAIREGVSGFLVTPHDSDSVAYAVEKIISSYETFSLGAFEWARAHDWSIIGAQFTNLIDTLHGDR